MKLEKNLDHSIITAFRGYLIISNWASNCEAVTTRRKQPFIQRSQHSSCLSRR